MAVELYRENELVLTNEDEEQELIFGENNPDMEQFNEAIKNRVPKDLSVFNKVENEDYTESNQRSAVQFYVFANGIPMVITLEQIKRIIGSTGGGGTLGGIKFRVEGESLEVSYDDGETWTAIGIVKGDDGEDGKTPYIQDGYWYINGVNTNVKAKGVDGNDGYTPQKNVDYFDGKDGKSAYEYAKEGGFTGTEAEFARDTNPNNIKSDVEEYITEDMKAVIVSELIAELQGLPVFGVVDENNTITVTSQLSDGTYTLMYENADGTLEAIGTITVGNGEVVEYTNLVDTTLTTDTTITLSSQGWLENVRINSSNAIVTADGNHITNIIPVGNKNVLRIKNMDIYGGYGRIYLYAGTTFVYSIKPADNSVIFTSIGDEYSEVTIAKLQEQLSANVQGGTFDSVRIGGTLIGTKEDVIVTLDEEIT